MKIGVVNQFFEPQPIQTIITPNKVKVKSKIQVESNQGDEFTSDRTIVKANHFHPYPPKSIKKLIRNQAWDEALQALDTLQPRELAQLWRSYIYQNQEQWSAALIQIDSSLAQPTDKAYIFKANWFQKQNLSADSSLLYARKAYQYNPKNSQAVQIIGTSFKRLKQADSTLYYLKLATQLNRGKSSIPIMMELAETYERQGNTKSSDSLLYKAIRKDPQDIQPRLMLSQSFYRRGMVSEAQAQIVKASKISRSEEAQSLVYHKMVSMGFCQEIETSLGAQASFRQVNSLLDCWKYRGQLALVEAYQDSNFIEGIQKYKLGLYVETKNLPKLKKLRSRAGETLELLDYYIQYLIDDQEPPKAKLYELESVLGESWTYPVVIHWWLRLGDVAKARQLYNAWAEVEESPQVDHTLSKILNKEQKHKQAFSNYLKIVEEYPQYLPSRYNALMMVKNSEDSLWAQESSSRLNAIPYTQVNNPWPWLELKYQLIQSDSLIKSQVNQIDSALQLIESKLSQDGSELLHSTWIAYARGMYQAEKYNRVVNAIMRVPYEKLKNQDVVILINSLSQQKRWNLLAKYIEDHQILKRNSNLIRVALAHYYHQVQDTKNAIKLLEKSIQDTEDPDAHQLKFLSQLFREQDQIDSASEYLERAIQASPDQVVWRFEYIELLKQQSKTQEVQEEILKLKKMNLSLEQLKTLEEL